MKKRFFSLAAIVLTFAATALLTSCKKESVPKPDNWAALDDPYGIVINPYNGDIIITTNGNYTTSGDCYVFDRDYQFRLNGVTLGSLPSNAVALDEDRILVINEGTWGANDAEVSMVDVENGTAVTNWFSSINGRGLGDVAQDIKLFDNKAYVTVSFSNSIEIFDPQDGHSTQLSVANEAQTPRYLAAEGNNVYVTCYKPACVLRIDKGSQTVTGKCTLGSFNPEGICALGNKLYVCSSNISDENYHYSYDNKLYVVDINSFTLTDSITVGYNPNKIKVLDDTHLVVSGWGDYVSNPAGTYLIDVNSKSVTKLDVTLYNFDIFKGKLYGYTSPYDNDPLKFYEINPLSGSSTEILPRAEE